MNEDTKIIFWGFHQIFILIMEVNKDEEQNGEEELNESELQIDNLNKKEIMRFMPIYQKKTKKKGKILTIIIIIQGKFYEKKKWHG